MDDAGAVPAEPEDGEVRPWWWALAILVIALACVDIVAAVAHQSAFSEFLAQARACVELNDCPSKGGITGLYPLTHGASWIRLLAHALRTGRDLTWVQDVVAGMLLASVPVTFFFLKRRIGLGGAVLALGLYVPVVVVTCDITDLTYTNLLPLEFAIYYASLSIAVERRSALFGALGGAALAAAVSAELGSITMVPFHVLVIARTARRPLLAGALALLSFAIPIGWESTDAVRLILDHAFSVFFVGSLATGLAVIAVALRWFLPPASADVPERVRAVMAAALVYATLTVWLVFLGFSGGWPAPRYLQPAAFPFLYLVGERMASLGRRRRWIAGTVAVVSLALLPFARDGLKVLQVPVMLLITAYALGVGVRRVLQRPAPAARLPWPAVIVGACSILVVAGDVVVVHMRDGATRLTMRQAEPLVAALYSSGFGYAQLVGALQGPAADELLPLLSERDPERFRAPERSDLPDDDLSLVVVEVPKTQVAATRDVIAAVPAGDARSLIVLRGGRSYLDWRHVRACGPAAATNSGALDCAEPRREGAISHSWPFVDFGPPPDVAPQPRQAHAHVEASRFVVPVRVPGRGVPHIVRLPSAWPATWRITRVSGVGFEGSLPGAEIRLVDRNAATGVIEMEFTPSTAPWVWIPPVVEVRAEDEHLLDAYR